MENEEKKVEYSAETKKAGMVSISAGAFGLVGELIAYFWARSQYGDVQFHGSVLVAAIIMMAYGWWKHERAKVLEDKAREQKKDA